MKKPEDMFEILKKDVEIPFQEVGKKWRRDMEIWKERGKHYEKTGGYV